MQTPKSILLHLDSSPRATVRIQLARSLADAFEAEVTGLPCTLTALMRYPYALSAAPDAISIMKELDKERRDKALALFVDAAAGSPRLHWEEPIGDEPWAFARRALYADLLVLGQRNEEDPDAADLPPEFVSSVLVECGKPALIVPYAGTVAAVGQTVLIAWKETRESARAVTAALPWLSRARSVQVVAYGEAAEASLRRLQTYLRTQGVDASVRTGGVDDGEIGERLLSLAADVGADLLVMGCYGHSRAREWVVGGATRSILQSMTLPVLMAH
ncbi:Nucleotide-binding universal stress protein, UspA family [Variovorax sp. HW608]|uniref:universal stress protein n=1 Tax=Variovorax sp. HW608 TaxID=1034889 RepID=UPI00081FD30F|nr:universal stress protein [Variovorax sp. HW608]SCK28201.1 Nucleotide-binding universal stress protein, UspA family [Variovorax sp. HW608]